MLYEFIATLSAGFALAGIALIIRHLAKLLFKIQTPKWLTPLFAAIGIFAFQIHQEYHWYEQTAQKLPKGTEVIKTIETTSWYRPWTYAKPFIVRFIAADTNSIATNQHNPDLRRVNLYLFERRISTKRIGQIVDCQNIQRADDTLSTVNLTEAENSNNQPNKDLQWVALNKEDTLFKLVCSQ